LLVTVLSDHIHRYPQPAVQQKTEEGEGQNMAQKGLA